jgi:hypothetical protein
LRAHDVEDGVALGGENLIEDGLGLVLVGLLG